MKDKEVLKKIFECPLYSSISIDIKRNICPLKYHLPSSQYSFINSDNKGRIEGINNKINVLNWAAYGYRNFYTYRNRIFLHIKLKE